MATAVRSVGNVDLAVGLVTCPVKMIGVNTSHDRKGSMYHPHEDGTFGKVKMPKVCEDCGAVVPTGEIAKGFEENGDVVILTASELETVAASTGGSIEIPHFVYADQIDPMLFSDQNVYRLVPDTKRGRQAKTTYQMIRQQLVDDGLVGVVQYTRWGRNRLGLLDVEPTDDGGVLVIRNMMWPDELRTTEGLLPTGMAGDVDERLIPVMRSVIQSMTTDWNPAAYADTYTEQLSAAIEAKASGGEIATVTAEANGGIDDVSDLLAKLEATAAARGSQSNPPKKVPAKKTAAKKAAPKEKVA